MVEAGKSENTKLAKKVRETWSGSDILRELTSTADRAMRPLAMKYRGVTSTRSSATIDRQFDQMIEDLNRDKPDCVVSGDISTWSARGDRNAWHEHHDYVLHTAKVPEGVSFKHLWADIKGVCSKMGIHENWDSNLGMYQGFTATGDTLLNQHLCLYSIRVAKERGVFTEDEACFAAGLIDDFVITAKMQNERPMKDRAETVLKYFKIVCEVFESAGAAVDDIKTILSTIKILFLNAFFCEGSEVLLPMKTAGKVERSHYVRFATPFQHCNTIF